MTAYDWQAEDEALRRELDGWAVGRLPSTCHVLHNATRPSGQPPTGSEVDRAMEMAREVCGDDLDPEGHCRLMAQMAAGELRFDRAQVWNAAATEFARTQRGAA